MRKRLFTVLLSLLLILSLLPCVSSPIKADNAASVIVGAVRLNDGDSATCNEEGAVTKSSTYSENDPISFKDGVLTLNGAVIKRSAYVNEEYAAVATTDGDLTISVKNTNTIVGIDWSNSHHYTYGIYVYGKLTILLDDGAVLNTKGGAIGDGNYMNTVGIRSGDLTVSGKGTVNAVGGDTIATSNIGDSEGLSFYGQYIRVENGAVLNMLGGQNAEAVTRGTRGINDYNASNPNLIVASGASARIQGTNVAIAGNKRWTITLEDDAEALILAGGNRATGCVNTVNAPNFRIFAYDDVNATEGGTEITGQSINGYKKVVFRQGRVYPLYVAGTWVTSDNASDLSVIDGVTGTASFDGTTNTLNLEDATITGGYGTEELGGAVVYTGADTFHIIASGTNTITGDERTYYSAGIYIGNPEDQNNSAGLDCDFDLILAEGSVLNVSGGPAKGYTYSASHGIGQFTYGGFAVSGAGTLNANGTDAPYTYGILTNGVWGGTKEFAISEGVTVNATAGETQSGSIGIATGYLLLNVTGNSSITAFAGSADAYSYGIEAFAPVTIDTTGTVTASGNDARIHEWAGSYGINAPYGITINKGTVTATAASAGVEENYSYGIRSNNGKIMINGGTVTALTTSKIGSYAALNYPPILGEGLIAGGSVNADGKNAVAYNAEDNATYTWFRTPFVQYKVTFDMQGHGAAINTQDVTAGYKAERPEDPTEEGYTFKGWYLNDTEYDFETPVTSDLTLKAKWEPVYHYLTFTVDGENYAIMMVEYGYPAMPLDDPVKEGYTFIGWYEGDTKFDFDTPIRKDYDLEARWEKNPDPAPTHDVIRLSGKTRYETSIKAADELKLILGTDRFDNIVLATGKDFADALGGGYLATKKNAPILLTNDKNAAAVNEYINKNLKDGGTVYVLGGEGAVSQAALAGINGEVKRLSGKSRYETNLAILNEAGVSSEDILICSGTSFADALAASASGRPMLLVNTKKNALTDGQKEFLSAHTSNKLYILGGTGAVSDILEEAVKAYGTPQRVYGSSRYETSVEIAKAFFADPSMAVVASAQAFPDGLCAGPLGYALKAPILLVKDGKEVPASSYCVENDITDGYIVGGAGAVSDVAASVVFHLPGDVTIIVK